jgi:predicted nuclease of predicted toxin-antitoxin system
MKILIDMNLSPRWQMALAGAGWEALHWSQVGAPTASDREIMSWAAGNGFVVFTHDLDFSALLAATQGEGPSVIQVRIQNILPEAIESRIIINALKQFQTELEKGAIVTVEPHRAMVRVLPYEP